MQLLLAKKQFAEAAQEVARLCCGKNPGHPRTLFLTAYAHQMSANEERAIALYQEMISANPELPEPRNNLAMIYLAQGDYDRASELLVEAINTHSSYAIAYANLRQVYKGIASEAYRRAVSESSEPANYNHDIELIAITWLDTVIPDPDPVLESVADPGDQPRSLDQPRSRNQPRYLKSQSGTGIGHG